MHQVGSLLHGIPTLSTVDSRRLPQTPTNSCPLPDYLEIKLIEYVNECHTVAGRVGHKMWKVIHLHN